MVQIHPVQKRKDSKRYNGEIQREPRSFAAAFIAQDDIYKNNTHASQHSNDRQFNGFSYITIIKILYSHAIWHLTLTLMDLENIKQVTKVPSKTFCKIDY